MEKIKEYFAKNRAMLILTITLVVGLGVSFAFFIPQLMSGAIGNLNIDSDTTDQLVFDTGDDLSFSINQFTAPQGGDKYVWDETYATASLTANSYNKTAEYTYNVYLAIDSNPFVYTTEDKKPELIAYFSDPTGNEITELSGFTYDSDLYGFDITEFSGLIPIALDYQISSNSSSTATIQGWEFGIAFVNLDTDQEENTNKKIEGRIIIQQNKMLTLANHVKSLYTTDGENGLYLHDGIGNYTNVNLEAGDGSYRYAGANPNNFVCFGSNEATCPYENLYRIIGVFGDKVKLIKYDAISASDLGMTSAYDMSISDLISRGFNYKGKLTTIQTFYWSGSSQNIVNDWTQSTLNTTALNGAYLTNLGSWSDKIAETTWIVGGNSQDNIEETNAQSAYNYEIVNPVENTTHPAKIGMMYMSEYYYAADPTYWTLPGYDDNGACGDSDCLTWVGDDYSKAVNNNWMFIFLPEWSITRVSDRSYGAFFVESFGFANHYTTFNSFGVVRPSFNLGASVTYSGGSGSSTDPYRIS